MNQTQFTAPELTKINKFILICSGVMFLTFSILKAIGAFSLVNLLGLSASGLFSGLIFQLVTYPVVETQLMSFLFNGLVVWFIGSELERQWGSKIYLRFILINVLGVGLIYSLVNLAFFYGTYIYSVPLHGLTGINFSMLIAYSLLYPDRQMSLMMIFPMRAKTFCWILAGIEAYMAVFTSLTSSWAHLLAMGFSYLVIHFQTKPIVRTFLNATWPKAPMHSKKHLYVVKDDNQKPPKFWQ